MTDMAFVGPMTMALALGALALFDDEDVPLPRREARIGRRKLDWPHHPLFYVATGAVRGRDAAAAGDRFAPARVVVHRGAAATSRCPAPS